ncbi:MAG: UDP-N-acetylmuramoyl-L-alanine--D-glutamate ligase [Pseudomonadota bacterium]
MIPVRGYQGAHVAVLGLGRSGMVAAHALVAGGATVSVWDDHEATREKAADEGLHVADLTKDKAWEDVQALIVSPGIAHLYPAPHPVIRKAWAHGAVVDNDIGLFFRSFATSDWDRFDTLPRVICVTGSNGKSTTTALIAHILAEVGRDVQMAGNIGRGVLDLDPAADGSVVVLELSSYQTELARSLAPNVAVFMNLSADHLDRHGGMGGYFAAKERLFTLGNPDRAIIGVDEDEGAYLANRLRQDYATGDPVIEMSVERQLKGGGWSIYARKGHLVEWRKGRQVASIDLRDMTSLPGVHNHQNACAAYAAVRTLGISPKAIEDALGRFNGLPHRCQVLGAKDGVTFVNDSKATNTDAAEQALKAFQNIRWIVGGEPKEGGISGLAPHFDRVKKAYLIGETMAEFAAQLGGLDQAQCGTIEQAVEMAMADADVGDVILLAPAAASFDQYPNFEKRGEAFIAAAGRFLGELPA